MLGQRLIFKHKQVEVPNFQPSTTAISIFFLMA